MKLYFNKVTLEGRWYDVIGVMTPEYVPPSYTDKVPPHANVFFDEEADNWVDNPPAPQVYPDDTVPDPEVLFHFDDADFM